jgi:hypothetical protein
VQEAIFAAATELNQATTVAWDENSMEINGTLEKVIDVNGLCDNNISHLAFRRLPGHITQNTHRVCLDNPATGVASTNVNNGVNALEDMVKTNQPLFINSNPNQSGYKSQYSVSVAVTLNPAFNGNAVVSQNLKRVTVTISDTSGNIVTTLVAYVANIGEVTTYLKRTL